MTESVPSDQAAITKRSGWLTWRRVALAAALLAAFGVGTAAGGGTKTVTKTKTEIVTKAPAACAAAIADARLVARLAGGQFGHAATLFPLVSQAAQAGANGDTAAIYAIAAKMRTFTAGADAAAARMATLADRFSSSAAACK